MSQSDKRAKKCRNFIWMAPDLLTKSKLEKAPVN